MIVTDCKQYTNEIYNLEKQVFSDFWSYNTICETMSNGRYFWAVYILNNIPAGYICVSSVADEATIERIAVDKKLRCHGIATALINCFLQNVDFSIAFLEVRSKNESAINLYKKFNFTQIAVRKNYYNNPNDNAVIMMLRKQ